MQRVQAAIIGPGNIGTDLMIKMIKYPKNMELAAVVGIDPQSEGLAMARDHGIATTHEGMEGLKKPPCYKDIGIAFDATSAYAHNKLKIPGRGEFTGVRTMVLLEVEGAGDYLPSYSGNLGIMTAAAKATGELLAGRRMAALGAAA
jgi:acetaldehyde dehydrogenase (acetylating)